MNPDEFYEYEGRFYQNPTKTRDETLTFVDSLRDTVGRDNQAIATQTEMLGTNVPSNLGGLTGSEGYFAQRYQTTPIETQVSALKATAQADALNKLMTNYRNQAQNRYNQAYRNYQKRSSSAGGGGDEKEGEKLAQPFDEFESRESITMPLEGWPEGTDMTAYGTWEGGTSDGGTYGYRYYKDSDGHILYTDNPDYWRSSNGYYYDPTPYMTDRTRNLAVTEEMKTAFADRIARSKGDL